MKITFGCFDVKLSQFATLKQGRNIQWSEEMDGEQGDSKLIHLFVCSFALQIFMEHLLCATFCVKYWVSVLGGLTD